MCSNNDASEMWPKKINKGVYTGRNTILSVRGGLASEAQVSATSWRPQELQQRAACIYTIHT
jgi:hypothetical protein